MQDALKRAIEDVLLIYSHEQSTFAEARDALLKALAPLIEALKVTRGNIRSLGPAGQLDGVPYAPYRKWLELVESALQARE